MIFTNLKIKLFFIRYLRYILVGLVNVSLDIFLYKLLLSYTGNNNFLSSLLSGLTVIIIGFVLHSYITFSKKTSLLIALRYFSYVLIILLITNLMALMLSETQYLFKLYQLSTSALINFLVYKLWVFKK